MNTFTPRSILPFFFTLLVLSVPRSSAQSTWNGATSTNWGLATNWTPSGVPGSATAVVFGDTAGSTVVGLDTNRFVASMAFTSDADAYTFNGTGYLGLSTTAGVSLAYGLTNTETFASSFTMGGNGGNLWLRNNSLAGGTFVIGGTLTTADNNTRYMSLDGLGGGSISGTIANLNSTNLSGLRSVGGGGTWTFTGTNTSTGGGTSSGTRLDLANGATLVADYRSNNATKFASAQRVNFSGGNLTIKGNTNAATVVTLNSTELAGSLTAGSLLGFGSVLTTEKSGANALTVNLGGITRATTGLLSYLRVQGDGTLNTTQALANSILAGVFIGSDYATTNASGVVVARPDVLAYSALGTNSTGSGSTVYSISGNFTSSITNNTAVQWYGMKFNTTGAGQSYTATGNTTVNILGTQNASLLFVGADDYSINATTIGRATADNRAQTILNTGAGVLTINAALATVSGNTGRILFGGPGKTVLTTGATGNAGQVAVAEGTLSLSHNNALGSETANVYVQSGGTLELQNNITLSSANTVNLHGLGNGGNGALRNLSGTNTVAGNVVLGISGRIKAESGSSLTINGTVSAPDGETSTLILDGAGNTTLAGSIASSVTGGLNKTGSGTATLSGSSANAYTGATLVTGGTLKLGKSADTTAIAGSVTVGAGATLLLAASNQVADSGAVTLSGGTITRDGNITEVFGNLNLTAASFLDYGAGAANTLRFGAYNPILSLTVQNFAIGNKLQFGNSISAEDLSTKFSFSNGYTTGTEGGFFTITAVPEPSSIIAAAGLLGLMLWPVRHRFLLGKS